MSVDDIARAERSRIYMIESSDGTLAFALQEELRFVYGPTLAVQGFMSAPTFLIVRHGGEDAFPRSLLRSLDYTIHDVDPAARLYVPGNREAL